METVRTGWAHAAVRECVDCMHERDCRGNAWVGMSTAGEARG